MMSINCKINPKLVREGPDYYTETVSNFHLMVMAGQAILGGGGRYNTVLSHFGGPYTIIGFGSFLGTCNFTSSS